MNWINLEVKTLRSEEYISSDPTERATWLNLLAWCCEQENGGVIEDCRAWGDRKWSQICGVFKSEIEAGKHLFFFEGNNLRIVFYPLDKEEEVQTKRNVGKVGGSATSDAKAEAARINGSKGGRPPKETQAETQAEKPNNPSKTQAETQGKGKEGKGKEGNTPQSPPAGGLVGKQQIELAVASVEKAEPASLRPVDTIPANASRKPKADQKRIRVKANTDTMQRIGLWFRRQPDTLWSVYEALALQQLGDIPPDDLDALEAYYTATHERDYRRHDIVTLLNNWTTEIDRARQWAENPNRTKNNDNGRKSNFQGRNAGTLNEGVSYANAGFTAADILPGLDNMDDVPA